MGGPPKLKAGVGRSSHRNAQKAGREAALAAREALGSSTPAAVLVFATSAYDQVALLASIREVMGEVPLAGCSGSGIITQAGSEEESHRVGVMALAGEGLEATPVMAGALSRDPAGCGRALGEQIRASARGDEQVVLLFTDGLSPNASVLTASLQESMGLSCPVVGAAAADAFLFEKTFQYCDATVASDAAVAMVLRGRLHVEVEVSHGCDVFGLAQTITRADGGWVQEIDGQPAWSFFRTYLGEDGDGLDAVRIAYLCLAEYLPQERRGRFGDYLLRVPLSLDKNTGALLFPGNLKEGTRVHVALRNPETIRRRAVESAQQIAAAVRGQKPAVLLQFDCVGRGRLLFSDATTQNLIAPMQERIGTDVPWLGTHSYGEYATLGGRAYYHNFTVALCALYEQTDAAQ